MISLLWVIFRMWLCCVCCLTQSNPLIDLWGVFVYSYLLSTYFTLCVKKSFLYGLHVLYFCLVYSEDLYFSFVCFNGSFYKQLKTMSNTKSVCFTPFLISFFLSHLYIYIYISVYPSIVNTAMISFSSQKLTGEDIALRILPSTFSFPSPLSSVLTIFSALSGVQCSGVRIPGDVWEISIH